MIDFEYEDLYKRDSVNKQMHIVFDGGEITNKELHSQQFQLKESLCSKELLRFGTCESSEIKFRISNVVTPLVDKELTVKETLDGNTNVSFQFGKYKVHSDNPTANRRYRDIVAYDSMYDILTAEVSGWYNTILPDSDSTVTLKQFRSSFLEHLGVEQEDVTLVNDSMIVRKTIEPSQLSGKTVITAICEINGCFGHIGRDGRFKYVILKPITKGIVPSVTLYPREGLYPSTTGESQDISKSHYISAQYEDFVTEKINKLQLRQEENDIGCIYGNGDNCYIVQDNFLLYGKSTEELMVIAENMYRVISEVSYRPAHVEAKGNPCLEVGDGIELATSTMEIDTYILQRTLKGIQALRDTYDAEGTQKQKEKVNGVNEKIIQLKGKTNKLTRSIEETRSEIQVVEKNLEKNYSTTTQMNSAISQKASEITLGASKIYETKTDSEEKRTELSGKITLNANNITAEVKRAQNQEVELAAAISVNADSIKLKVTKGNISSEISQESGKISIKSNRFSLESTNCTISENGTITAKNVDLTGKITASSGEIGGFTIGTSAIYSGYRSSFTSSSSGIYIGTDGLSIGANSSKQFKVTADGEVTILGTGGSITLGSTSSGRMILDKGGISFGSSSLTTEITKDKVKVHDNYMDANGLHCGGTSSLYTEIIGAEIKTYYDYDSFIKIGYKDITLGSGDTHKIIHGTTDLMSLMSNAVMIYPTYSLVGKTDGYLGFFGSSTSGTCSKKKTVSTVSTSATASTIATKLNELINALKAYNLIG